MDTKQLKQKILDLAIRGKLVPQDPNDEPASGLLERIRAEKEQLIAQGKLKKSKSKISDKPHYENVPFEIPESWEWVMVEDIASIIHGRSQSAVINPDGIYPIYGSGGIMGYADDYLCPEHCTIIGRKGTINNPILIETKFWNVDTAFGLHPHEAINYIYFHYFCKSFDFTKLDKSTTLPSLTKTSIEQIHFPLPPLTEQQRIVAEVEKWFALIDELEANKEDLKDYIKQVKSKVLDLAIHGKLVPQAPNDEPAIELLKRINPNFKPCDTSHYENLPSGWCICLLEDIIDYEQPTQYIVASTDYNDEYKTPVLTAGKSFILGYTNESNGIYNNLPTIIFDDFTTDSRLVDFPFKVKSSAMKILQVNKGINIQYVAYFMSITRLAGNTHKRYWISEYSKIPIPIPPKEEQDRIVKIISEIENKLDSISAEL